MFPRPPTDTTLLTNARYLHHAVQMAMRTWLRDLTCPNMTLYDLESLSQFTVKMHGVDDKKRETSFVKSTQCSL